MKSAPGVLHWINKDMLTQPRQHARMLFANVTLVVLISKPLLACSLSCMSKLTVKTNFGRKDARQHWKLFLPQNFASLYSASVQGSASRIRRRRVSVEKVKLMRSSPATKAELWLKGGSTYIENRIFFPKQHFAGQQGANMTRTGIPQNSFPARIKKWLRSNSKKSLTHQNDHTASFLGGSCSTTGYLGSLNFLYHIYWTEPTSLFW